MSNLVLPNNDVRFAIAGIKPESTLIFQDRVGKEVFSITEEGIYYKGKLVEIDKDIENAFREFLLSQGKPVSFSMSAKEDN